MNRIKCTVSYDGIDFNGFQIQPKGRTVQGEIESALKKIHKGEFIRIHGSGRTDAGVHAFGQVIHFDSPLSIPGERWSIALNTILSKDIVIRNSCAVHENFHARYDVKVKEYRYHIFRDTYPNVFLRNYSYHFPYELNTIDIRAAIEYFKGEHDFTSFCSAKTDKENKVRTIYDIRLEEKENELIFTFIGNGFLYNMVRIIVGTLLDIGQGRKFPEQIPEIIEAKNPKYAGKKVPGHGLYLWEVSYEDIFYFKKV